MSATIFLNSIESVPILITFVHPNVRLEVSYVVFPYYLWILLVLPVGFAKKRKINFFPIVFMSHNSFNRGKTVPISWVNRGARTQMLIREVILENFMSYEYARIPFKKGVNVACGPNGSGKSSILLGISVALGQSSTERSKRLSDLIRYGKRGTGHPSSGQLSTKWKKTSFQNKKGPNLFVTKLEEGRQILVWAWKHRRKQDRSQ